MVNNKIKVLFVILVTSLVIGCSQLVGLGGKDFTVEEVIDQSIQKMAQEKGASYEIKGEQGVKVEASDKKIQRNDTFTMRMDLVQQPFAMHINGEIKSDGKPRPIDIYLVNETLFQKSYDGTWIKSEGISTDSLAGQIHKPDAPLEQLKHVLESLSDAQKESLITMKEREDAYQLEVVVTEKEEPTMNEIFQEQLKAALGPHLSQLGFPIDMDSMKLIKWKQVIWIEKESFTQKKVEQKLQVEMPVNSRPMKIEQKMVQTYVGPYTQRISVPEEVENSAK